MSRSIVFRRWSTLSLVAACLILGVLGYVFGGRNLPKTDGAIAPKISSFPDPSTLPERSAVVPEADSLELATPSPEPSWEDRWRELSARANTPARDRGLAALIELLAKTDPVQALALAKSESNWRLQGILRHAALRGWATVAPDAAADWALTVRLEDRRDAVAAVLSGSANNPPEAVRVALRLCANDPSLAGDFGHAAIEALVQKGDFESAAKFGTEVGSEKYPFLLQSAFFQWAKNQPAQAMAALDKIPDPVQRSQAYGEVLAGWAKADAKSLAEYALNQPAGEARNLTLSQALPHWVEKDPTAAMDWMKQHDSGPDFDAGISALAHRQTLITQQPATAMTMAGNLISDPAIRTQTMRNVFRQWAETDPAAARRYLDQTPEGPDRKTLLNELRDLSPDG